MSRFATDLERRSLAARFLFPAALVLLIWVSMTTVYDNAWKLGMPALQEAVSWLCGLGGELFRGLAPLIAYPLAYFRGAAPAERAAASLGPFLAWWLLQVTVAAGVFSSGEAVYYGFSQNYLLSLFVTVSVMGVCELICRWVRKRRGGAVGKVWTPAPVAAILSGPVAAFVLIVWGGGVHWFYLYQEGYKLLFR